MPIRAFGGDMISGVGIDIISVERVRKAMERPAFLGRFFSEEERRIFALKNNAPQTVAAHFAMKEAVSKALGTGVRGFDLRDISITRDELGKPVLVSEGRLREKIQSLGIHQIHISCSHEKEMAIGYAVAEKASL